MSQFLKRIVLLAALVLPVCSFAQRQQVSDEESWADSPEFRLAYSVFFPSTHVQAVLAKEWAEEIYARTRGRVKIDVYPGGVLSGANENFECVVKGISHVGMSCFSYSRGMFPMLEGLDLPLGYHDGVQATRIANNYFRKYKMAELDDVEVMYLHAHGPGILAARKEFESIDSIKGMSIRGTGVSALIIRAIGGNAIGMSQNDTYEALRKGIVDATLCPVETLKGWSQGEVIHDAVRIPSIGYTTAMFVVMNKQTWNAFPQDIRQIIAQINEEWIDRHGQKWVEADNDGEAFIASLGRRMLSVSPEDDAKIRPLIDPILSNWAQSLEKQGYPGNEALAFLREQIAQPMPELMPPVAAVHGDVFEAEPLNFHHTTLIVVGILVVLASVFTAIGGRLQELFWKCYQIAMHYLTYALAALSVVALLGMVALTCSDVILRKFGFPIHGAIDIVQLLACIFAAAALPYLTAVKGHIAIEFFFRKLSPGMRAFVDGINRILVILFYVYLIWSCATYGARLLEKNATCITLNLPYYWILWVMSGCFAVAILATVYNLTHPGKELMRP